MKTTLFSILTLLFVSSLFLPNGFAQYVPYSILEGHRDRVYSVAFSPDGTTLASGSRDNTVRLWDAVTGAPKATLEGHRGDISSVAFSPDGTTLASGSSDNTVRLWDVGTGTPKATLEGHRDSVSSVAFSPDGTTLASRSRDNTVRLWDAVTGAHKHTLRHGGDVSSIAFSPDGTTLASGSSDDSTVRSWDAVTGTPKATLEGHRDSVSSVAFSPDGTTLASGSSDNTVRLWDVATGTPKATLEGHRGYIYSIAFSPDGTTLASGSEDNTVRLWDAVTGTPKATLEGHRGYIYSIAFSPDGTTLASRSWDNTVWLWDAVTGTPKATLEGHRGYIYSIAFSPDGTTLASGSEDNTVRLWELPSTHVGITTPSPVKSLAIGSSLTFPLNIADGENIAGYQATVGFDNGVLRYLESANGDYLPEGAFFVPPVVSTNRVTLGATSLAGVSNGDGTLATVTFEVVDVGRRPVLFLSQARLTDSDSKYLSHFVRSGGIIEPAATPSPAVISITPSPVLSPAIRQQLVFNVDIAGGQNVAGYQLAWVFDSTVLKLVSGSKGDYLAGGVGNGDGTLTTGTFVVDTVKASTVSVSGYLIRSNGVRYTPTFEGAEVIAPLLGDVNRDGVVNILDLTLVGSSFTKRVPDEGNPADVNESSVVDIVDLVLVAGAFSNAAAAPSAHQLPRTLTAADVEGWLTQAQQIALTDPTYLRGIAVLEQLLVALTPRETVLLPNYPNPFNPETWIPYHLADDADLTLTIYDTKGAEVRQLDLGHQPAGYYTARSKAAYWDGCNESGESVASGVYFYQLRVSSARSIGAGDYSKTRRMVILK